MNSSSSSILDRLDELLKSGAIQHDAQQHEVARNLQRLHDDLMTHAGETAQYSDAVRVWREQVRQIEHERQAQARLAAMQWAETP